MIIDCLKNKKLEVNDSISFVIGTNSYDGKIINKEYLDKGDIYFTIELNDGKGAMKVKHRNLNLIFHYETTKSI